MIAMKRTGGAPILSILESINGSFHLLSLVAAGEMLRPISRRKRETGEARLGSSLAVELHIAAGVGSSSVEEQTSVGRGAGIVAVE